MATKPKRARKGQTLFTDKIRREICGGNSYILDSDRVSVSVVDAVDHPWHDDHWAKPPTLRKVVISLVEEAYRRGLERGREEIRDGIKSLLRAH